MNHKKANYNYGIVPECEKTTVTIPDIPSSRLKIRKIMKKKIPLLRWLPSYTLVLFLQDLLAGFTVGLTLIPQAIAYASIAELPSQYGLYSGFMGCFVYFFFGSLKDINIGPTAMIALMIQPSVIKMGVGAAVLLTFLTGCIIFLLGLFRLGFVIDFFSYPVVAGFTIAAALDIASSQLKEILGISGRSKHCLETIISIFQRISDTRKWDAILGVLSIIFLVVSKEIRRYGTLAYRPKWSKRRNIIGRFIFLFALARNALTVIVGTLLAYYFSQKGEKPFMLIGNVQGGLPNFTLPPFGTNFNGKYWSFGDMVQEFGTVIIFCPFIAVLEHVTIARIFFKGRTPDASQELMASGLSNIVGSFVSSMPITGSFSRTAINNSSGVKTTTSGVITGIMVLLALSFLSKTFEFIPKSSLASVVIVAMYYLCDFEAFPFLWKTKKIDLIPLVVTLFCSLLISLESGILIGISVNFMYMLYSTVRPKLEVDHPSADIYIVKPTTGLYFAASNYVKEVILKSCIKVNTTVVIDGKYIGNMDVTFAKGLAVLKDELEMRNQKLLFINFRPSVKVLCCGASKDLEFCFNDENLDQI